jgi:hypothetical protein
LKNSAKFFGTEQGLGQSSPRAGADKKDPFYISTHHENDNLEV